MGSVLWITEEMQHVLHNTPLALISIKILTLTSVSFRVNITSILPIVCVFLTCHDSAPAVISPASPDTWDTWPGH